LLGKAIGYALGLWPQLTTFLEDGHIPLDNNLAENAIRPFVVGRNYAHLAIMRSCRQRHPAVPAPRRVRRRNPGSRSRLRAANNSA
jgi:hypothetical protein